MVTAPRTGNVPVTGEEIAICRLFRYVWFDLVVVTFTLLFLCYVIYTQLLFLLNIIELPGDPRGDRGMFVVVLLFVFDYFGLRSCLYIDYLSYVLFHDLF